MTLEPISDIDRLPSFRGVIAKSGGPDKDGQFLDREWLATALNGWFASGATVTTNFDHTPVAKCFHLFTDDHGQSFKGDVAVLDTNTAGMVADGVLRGLSIGIQKAVTQPYNDSRGLIVGGRISVSFIDEDFWDVSPPE